MILSGENQIAKIKMQNDNVKFKNELTNHPARLCGDDNTQPKNKCKVMRCCTIVLFVLGVFLTIAAFFIDHSNKIHFVLSIVSPNSAKAKQGVESLYSKEMLISVDVGFKQISKIFLKELATLNPPEKIKNIEVVSIKKKSEVGLTDSDVGIKENVPIEIELSNGLKTERNLKEIESLIDEDIQNSLLVTGFIILFTGVSIEILMFVIK